MSIFADLHIHSCLSPCGDQDMTPGNICAMAKLKGLSAIAVTDHNSALNLPAAEARCRENDLILIPGIEITTSEEVHLLGYFDTVDLACSFGKMIRSYLPLMHNNPDYFGHQHVVDCDDNCSGEEEAMLIGAVSLTLNETTRLIREYGGAAVPAHINRGSNSLLYQLGFIPPELHFKTVEIWRETSCDPAVLLNRNVLFSSDAHYLGDIAEKDQAMELPFSSRKEILHWMKT